jgi:hypothetical protein
MRPTRHAQELVKKQFHPQQPVWDPQSNSYVTFTPHPNGVETTIPNWVVSAAKEKSMGGTNQNYRFGAARLFPGSTPFVSACCAVLLATSFAAAFRAGETPILGNYPNTVVALSTDTTITPDAAPSGATSINVATSTNFKGKLEAYPMTGVVRVTNAHPAGAYTVTMRAFDTSGASVTRGFTLSVSTPATCNPASFATAVNFGGGDGPYAMAVGDFNGDGKQDLAVTNVSSNSVSILLGDGSGSLGAPTSFAVGDDPVSVAVGDFNGDGKQDLAVANIGSDNVSVLLGTGTGSFTAAVNVPVGRYPYSVVVGDFNGDGKPDLATANNVSNNASVLLGDGMGHFSAAANFDVGMAPINIAAGDFNGDGKPDLAVANYDSNNVSILLGNGDGNFSPAINFSVGDEPASVTVGDFNNDGKQDLATADQDSNNVSILLGDGTGNFSAPNTVAAGNGPRSLAVGDFNGDGKQDLAVADISSSNVSLLLGDGTGGFSLAAILDVGTNPYSVVVGDFDGDGKQDLATANNDFPNPGSVSIVLRNCALTPTSVVSRKAHGSAGSFDIDLPVTGSPGIECRSGGATNDYTIVATFSGNVAVQGHPQAQVTSGTGTVGTAGASNGGIVTISGNAVTIPLTNVTNAQTINVTLFGVNGVGNLLIPMAVLAGDVNSNRAVNASDISLTKSLIGQEVDITNFRSDVNANGVINASDVSTVKSHVGSGVFILDED